ncbi:hypothetical protein FLONG3_9127 [Fusarium longipes]|uniref:peptidylprolyl isomerase n=1 Tax=Fusarium longipes TaxID=694270 RepID=A0A395RZY8_9HYPO|nr:hypothetical protein FLONG3_9127 [Fusarium longipes]
MSAVPGPVYGLEVPPGEILIPAAMEFPASFRITMAAVDPTEEPEADGEGNVPTVPRSTLRLVKRALPGLDDEDEDDEIDDEYMKALLAGSDDEEDSDEEANGGPSDPAKAKKQRQAAAIKKLLEAAQEESDEEMEDAKPNGKAKGKAKATKESDEEDEEDSDDDSEEGADLENFVICTLDTERNYQQPLDITVNHGEKVFFVVTGSHTVYLTGNYIMDDDEDDEDSEDEDEYDLSPDELEYGLEGDDSDASDDLDGLEDPRVQEIDTDEEEAPKLVAANKGKNKRAAEEAEGLDELISKDDSKLSKKQQKKLKNNKGEAVAAEEKKDAKKVQFAKNLEQGPTGSTEKAKQSKDSKPAPGVKVVQGVTIDDRTIGNGRTVKSGDTVGVRYIGKLQNGKQFDANKKGKPFSFKAGKGQVIKGWDIGVIGMAIGGERRLTIPAHLAYGSRGLPGIPANSTLIFDVKLLEINIMAQTLLKKASQQFIRLSSCDWKNALEPSPDSELNGPEGIEAHHGWKLGNATAKRWKPLRIIETSKDAKTPTEEQIKDQIKTDQLNKYALRHGFNARSPNSKELLRKLHLNPMAMTSNSTLVIRTPSKRARSSLQLLNITPLSDLETPPCSEASTKPSSIQEDSTAKTSIESSPSQQYKVIADRRYNRRNPWTRSSPEGRALSTIPEAGVIQARPTIATVERASAAKIFLETHFNELLYKPNTRALRIQSLEAHLHGCSNMSLEEKEKIRMQYKIQETCHLRELRAMKANCMALSSKDNSGLSTNNYEPLQILGKGSFGVVRLVREKPAPGHAFPGQVYAMKIIRKSEMIRNSQEGHLRAERDFLVASEGSQWAVPLIASFQDPSSLYLVMEYMPGGDFLGLLIRRNILPEEIAKFYIAEMILAIEEAHRLNFIHRDIKPDNFLISATGHLKISDFGLAFDDHWSHDAAYYNTHRYSLVRELGINIKGDEMDQKSSKDILKQFEWYQSLVSGIDRHGRYPLAKDEDLRSLIGWRDRHGSRTAARSVVGTSQYMAPEVVRGEDGFQTSRFTDYSGRYVFPGDAEDIKAHRWFRNIQWERLQSQPAPYIPNLKSDDDAHYFDESEPFEDWSESVPSGICLNTEDVRELLFGFGHHVQQKAMELIKVPFDAAKLRSMDHDIDAAKDLQPSEKAALKQFVRFYGHKERKRPRDMLLRDKSTKKTSLRIRKETAFMGYTWRRMRPGGYTDQKPAETLPASEVQVTA